MIIREEVQRLYASPLADGHTFEADLAAHVASGYVWSSPTALVMARLVRSDWSLTEWGQLDKTDETGDCWLVWLAAGDMGEFFRVCPRKTKFVCFSRRGFPRLYLFSELENKYYGIHAKASASAAPSSGCSIAYS